MGDKTPPCLTLFTTLNLYDMESTKINNCNILEVQFDLYVLIETFLLSCCNIRFLILHGTSRRANALHSPTSK